MNHNGKVSAAENITVGSIPREDVARTIVAALEKKHTYKRAFDLISGYDPIPDALQKF